MNKGEKIRELEKLTDRQRDIIRLILDDPKITAEQISIRLSCSINLVGLELTRIYEALIPEVTEGQKKGILIREYRDAFETRYPNKNTTSNVSKNKPTIEPTITPPPRRINQSVIIVGILGGFLLISIIAIGILLSVINGLNQPLPVSAATDTPLVRSTASIVPTIAPTSAPTLIPPTSTITSTATVTLTATPTFTPTVTRTPLPTAQILFEDKFDKELSPEWVVKSGTYSITDGKLGVLGNEPLQISIGDQTWKNYKVSFKVFNWLCSQTDTNFSFGIRGSSWTHKLLFAQVFGMNYGWAAQDGQNYPEITNTRMNPCYLGSNLIEISASGNKIDFLDKTSFIVSGYEQGGVYLWMKGNMLIDDFKVVVIP